MIIIRQTIQFLSDQVDAALDAPVPIAIGVAIAALLVWWAMKWRYDGLIERLRKSNERKESMIRLLKDSGAAPPVLAGRSSAALPVEPTGAAAEEGRNRQKALRKITNAIDAAQMARQSGDPGEVDKAMPAMGLGLLAARNVFDVRVPAPSGSAAADLDTGRRLLELVRPALLLGHDDEARRSADNFLRRAAAA